jgi:cell wall assembly regulator SMI1
VSNILARYASWLEAHAPGTAGAARPPASDAGIAAAEGELGAILPAPIRQLYRWHDGGPDNPAEALWLRHDFGFLPIEAAREIRQMRREIAEEEFDPEEADDFWSPHWFPIGTSWTGDHLVVDCSTSSAQGRLTIANNEGPSGLDPVWPNLDSLLDELVSALENGSPLSGHLPVTSNGWLLWEEQP